MEIKIARETGEAEVLVVPVFESESPQRAPLKQIDALVGGALAEAMSCGEITGRYKVVDEIGGRKDLETALWPVSAPPQDAPAPRRVMLIGAGKRADADAARMRKIAGTAARHLRERFSNVAFLLRSPQHAEAVADGFVAGDYDPGHLRSEPASSKLETLTLIGASDPKQARAGAVIGESVNMARELANTPASHLTPTVFAGRVRDALEPLGVEVTVLSGDELSSFGGLLGVAKGSAEPPVMLGLNWSPSKTRRQPVLGLVGKGITFDSGGLSLKPSDAMVTMKTDMAGAAAVVSAVAAIARLKIGVRVRAACPCSENMPSGSAMRVGDVLHMYSGTTVEVLNTDAEGRLVLADALAWIAEQGVTHLVDAATLTGAVEIALGTFTMGVMGRPDAFVDRVLKSARSAGERAWQLPLYPEYAEQLRSDVADIKNVGGRPAGAITAAKFLERFVPDELAWAHLDIAGVDWASPAPWRARGASGAAVRALVRLAADLAAK